MSVKAPACLDKVYALLARTGMLHAQDRVLVAVSGGPDSVCLLHVLLELGFPVEVAHFDHQTREGESTSDARFVQRICELLSVPFHIEARPVMQEAARTRMSFEQYARELRYEFFVRVARQHGCVAIATGHQADDQAETMLMRVIRGTTPRGLAGIPPIRMHEGVRIVRPLLDCTREEIMHFMHERAFVYRIDASNEDQRFYRNKIRHHLLPLLESEYNPKVEDALERLADAQQCENALLDSLTDKLIEDCLDEDGDIVRDTFRDAHEALQRRMVYEFALGCGARCQFEQVIDAVRLIVRGKTGEKLDLGHGVVLRNARNVTEVHSDNPDTDDAYPIACPGETVAFGRRFVVRILDEVPGGDLRKYCSAHRQVLDARILEQPLLVRTRRPGDRISPFGMRGSKKLKEYFIELGLTVRKKNTTPLIFSGDTIAWVVGHAIGEVAAIRADTKRCIEISVEPAQHEDEVDFEAPE